MTKLKKYIFPKVAKNKDGNFGPTKNGNFYDSVSYHNKTAKKKSTKTRWILKQNEQYEVFRVSDEGKWICKENKNGLFSILNKGKVIFGENGECLAFFPKPINTKDAWHGFPVTCDSYEPSVVLVDKWLKEDIIDTRIHIKILKGQL